MEEEITAYDPRQQVREREREKCVQCQVEDREVQCGT